MTGQPTEKGPENKMTQSRRESPQTAQKHNILSVVEVSAKFTLTAKAQQEMQAKQGALIPPNASASVLSFRNLPVHLRREQRTAGREMRALKHIRPFEFTASCVAS